MELITTIDINLIAFLLLGAAYYIAHRRLDPTTLENRTYLRTSILVLVQLLIETLTCIIDRVQVSYFVPITTLLNLGLFALAPFVIYQWYLLIQVLIYNNVQSFSKCKSCILILYGLYLVLLVLSPKYHFIFYIDNANKYHRGSFFYISCLLIYGYLIIGIISIIRSYHKIITNEFIPLFLLGLLPLSGGIFQIFLYGTLLIWSSKAFTLILVYIFLQQRMVRLDFLTGAWDRGSFDTYFAERLGKTKHLKVGLIYMDIDRLKQINDTFGHNEGDFAIKTLIALIKRSLRKDDIIVRMGGDEFVIVTNSTYLEELKIVIQKLELTIADYNHRSEKEYELTCSFGGSIFDSNKENLEQFLHTIDHQMYEKKRNKKTCDK